MATLIDDDIRHWQNIIEVTKQRLQILEEKRAKYGDLDCPPLIIQEIKEAQQTINNHQQRIRRRIRNSAPDDVLYTNEEVNDIYGMMASIHMWEGYISQNEPFVNQEEDLKSRYDLRSKIYQVLYKNSTLLASGKLFIFGLILILITVTIFGISIVSAPKEAISAISVILLFFFLVDILFAINNFGSSSIQYSNKRQQILNHINQGKVRISQLERGLSEKYNITFVRGSDE
jgi:hypothetical protein